MDGGFVLKWISLSYFSFLYPAEKDVLFDNHVVRSYKNEAKQARRKLIRSVTYGQMSFAVPSTIYRIPPRNGVLRELEVLQCLSEWVESEWVE